MATLPPGAFTALTITGLGLPLYSARGLHQTLEQAGVGVNTRRTVNGTLVNLAPQQFEKYKSRITGSDVDPPAIDGIFPGALVTVDCIAELSFPAGSIPQRGGIPTRSEGSFNFYRPRLDMMVTGFSVDTDEWGAKVGWTLDLEEV